MPFHRANKGKYLTCFYPPDESAGSPPRRPPRPIPLVYGDWLALDRRGEILFHRQATKRCATAASAPPQSAGGSNKE